MATTNAEPPRLSRERLALFVLLSFVLLAAIVAFLSWNRTPQMGADEEVFRTVDALFTAITARDEKLVTQCEAKLKAYREAGKLPTDAADTLDSIIAKARSGSWETAAERLYDFMKAQKREGAASEPPKSKPPKIRKAGK